MVNASELERNQTRAEMKLTNTVRSPVDFIDSVKRNHQPARMIFERLEKTREPFANRKVCVSSSTGYFDILIAIDKWSMTRCIYRRVRASVFFSFGPLFFLLLLCWVLLVAVVDGFFCQQCVFYWLSRSNILPSTCLYPDRCLGQPEQTEYPTVD